MTKTPVSLGVQSNPGRVPAAGVARLINCYAEDAGQEGKVRYPVYAHNGFDLYVTLSGGEAIRQALDFDETRLYVAAGARIWKVTDSATATLLSGTISASGVVTMARNRKAPDAQIGLVTSDGHYYILDTTDDSLTEVLLPVDAAAVVALCVFIGYFVLLTANGEFYVTSLDEGSDIDDLDFAAAEANPDGGSDCKTRGQDLVLFGPKSIEFWSVAVDADFPVQRAAAINIGCWLKARSCELVTVKDGGLTDTIAFLGTNSEGAFLGVMLLDGYGAVKISTSEVERAIRTEPDTDTIRLFPHTENGHVFLIVTGSSFTRAYDTTTGFWHEKASNGLDRWRPVTSTAFADKVILGDYETGLLYRSRCDLYDASNDCAIQLRHSNDNGETWNATRTKTISESSNPKQRIKFNRLGMSKEDGKVLELTMTRAIVENGTDVSMVITTPAVHSYPNPMKFDALYVDAITGVSKTSNSKGIMQLTIDARSVQG
jgi:hypothetical protein